MKPDNRNNPPYPPDHCFSVVECKKCGEYYEPFCVYKHICGKQNSYKKEIDEKNGR